MGEASDYGSIGPLNDAARKDSLPNLGLIALDMVATIVILYIVGVIVNAV